MILNSICWRLQAWHGLILVAVLTGFGLTAYHVARENQLRRRTDERGAAGATPVADRAKQRQCPRPSSSAGSTFTVKLPAK